jgi:hypothetical protein
LVKPVAQPPKSGKGAVMAPAAVPVEIDLTLTEAAWTKVEPRLRALPRGDVRAAGLDVTQAAAIAIAAVKNLLAHRAELLAMYREPPVARIEGVIEVALATQHADLLHRITQDKTALFADIFPRMTELRGLFLDDLDIQVKRKRCPAKFVADLRLGDRDAADFANDLNDAAAWYATNLPTLRSTTVETAEVAEARKLAATALARLGVKHVADAAKAGDLSPTEMRARAFTLLEREYEVPRQYGAALFWTASGGWEKYVPSLWVGRGTEGSSAPKTPAPPVPPTPANG